MSFVRNKKLRALALVCGAGVLFQLPGGCVDYYFGAMVEAFDICSVLNCEGGTFFDLCSPVPLFWDCPQISGF